MSKAIQASASGAFGGQTFDLPPVYAASLSSPTVTSQPRTASVSSGTSKPTNYLYLNREDNSIKGRYIIDSSISIPRSLLPPLRAGQAEDDRKNVQLRSARGLIYADITLLEPHSTKKPTSLDLHSDYGSVNLKLRTETDVPPPRTPFHANLTADRGPITVWLPRDFQGSISIYAKHGSVNISDALLERVAFSNEADHTQRLFIGDLATFSDEEGGNKGDELKVWAQWGRVRMRFVDELDADVLGEEKGKGKGLLSRMFGR